MSKQLEPLLSRGSRSRFWDTPLFGFIVEPSGYLIRIYPLRRFREALSHRVLYDSRAMLCLHGKKIGIEELDGVDTSMVTQVFGDMVAICSEFNPNEM